MESHENEGDESTTATSAIAPVLEYRSPFEKRLTPRWLEVALGSVCLILGVGMAAATLVVAIVGVKFAIDRETIAGGLLCGSIASLALIGSLCSLRMSWFYLGGWSRSSNEKLNREILCPWHWN